MPRCIPGKDADLAILHLAQGATVLPGDPHGVRPLFDKPRLIEHQHALRVAHRLRRELMVVPEHLLLIPVHITDEPLQPTDRAPSTRRAMGSIDLRSSRLHWPTISSKKWARGSLRAKQ